MQPLGITALKGQQVAHDAKHVDIVRLPVQNASEEIQFKIYLALINQSAHWRAGGGWFVPFVGVLAWMRHGLPPARADVRAARPTAEPPRVPSLIITGEK